MAQEYISQVSEAIEGRVTEKLSKEFSRTESRILGALSKRDEFLLNPQVRTCSVALPGTSRNNNSENREPTGDRSRGDPCPEAVFSTYHSGNLNDTELEETHHKYIQIPSIIINEEARAINFASIVAQPGYKWSGISNLNVPKLWNEFAVSNFEERAIGTSLSGNLTSETRNQIIFTCNFPQKLHKLQNTDCKKIRVHVERRRENQRKSLFGTIVFGFTYNKVSASYLSHFSSVGATVDFEGKSKKFSLSLLFSSS